MKNNLKPYIQLIQSGEVVAFPTETVYGLGADAWNPSAIRKVFETKGRPSDNPLIVHISDERQLEQFAAHISQNAQKLMDAFWPGPLTLVLNKKSEVLDLITAGLDTVALRMPNHGLALEFIGKAGPLVAPSANTSGRPSPTKAEHVHEDFGKDFPVIDGGPTEVGLESTVLDLTSEVPAILRPGKIGAEEISQVLGIGIKFGSPQNKKEEAPKSPGQKYSHYKPKASVFYDKITVRKPENLYLLQDGDESPASKNVINYRGNLELLSRELYDRFRQADLESYQAVFIEPIEAFKDDFPAYYAALINRIEKAASS
ncbi:L-threonylcarbamoyladenylate synthase [Gracilimonas mengyeensis]|uniref:Threonylcarbamoyl-AMP synthase n=1 Tax=Gracilimonas mengyeensis TaxID=1302730 RepID=A0A521DW35_9BACT|nr:L-threonylcarbamoyladenylate synthase [Gracilimonas mengyeensis]SMO75311.1 translation factor SUA5 [Gracilimonas mengyeensis]